ncbi:MAG: hypothetical protein PSY14_08620 [bacterium]|nr:hypothetical protein [bacterium]
MSAGPKKLKMVEAFDKASGLRTGEKQSGYEKVDDMRVVERYFHPVLWSPFESGLTTQAVVATLYDFKSFTAHITTMTIDKSYNLQGAPSHAIVSFRDFDNKQAIRDAHQALTQLGGEPPALEQFSLDDVSTKVSLAAPKTAQFGKKP